MSNMHGYLQAPTYLRLDVPMATVGRIGKQTEVYTFTALVRVASLVCTGRTVNRCGRSLQEKEMTYLGQWVKVGHHSTCGGPLVLSQL